ncbi:helix-turn-helix transcriptional regulator [Nocardia sp. NBC_00403]|uniref:helix-turn-helix transcriptional regulator n=1 Tax=Nocardia sp. NBC_00403 TaxID=2975990 RepID=UPI002E1ECBA4
MHTSEDYWLSRPELANRLKVPARTLDEWAHKGKGPRFAKIGRFSRYRLIDVEAWENAQLIGGSDAA